MTWMALAVIGPLLLVAVTVVAAGARFRASDARDPLELRPRPIAGRDAIAWPSAVGVVVVLLGAVCSLALPSDTPSGRLARVAVGATTGLAALVAVEVGRGRARNRRHALLAGGLALLAGSAVAAHASGVAPGVAAYGLFAAVAAVGAGMASRHRSQPALLVATAAVGLAPVLLRDAADPRLALGWGALLLGGAAALAAHLSQPWPAALAMALGTGLLAWWAPTGAAPPGEVAAGAIAWAVHAGASIGAARLARRRAPDAIWPAALLVAALALGHVPPALLLAQAPALLAGLYVALALAGAATLRSEGEPALLALPLAVASAALFGPCVQRAAGERLLATLALGAWCAVHQVALLRPTAARRIPTRAAARVAAGAGAAFLLLDGGVVAPHLPRWFAIVLALFAAAQIAAARAAAAPAVSSAAALFSAGGLLGAAAHARAHGARDAVLIAAALAWSAAFTSAPLERIVRRARPWRAELVAAAAAALALAGVGYAVPPESAVLRALVLAFPWAAPLGLGIALRGWPRAAAALLSLGLAVLAATFGVAAGGAAAAAVSALVAGALVASDPRTRSPLTRWLGLGVLVAAIAEVAVRDVWRLSHPHQIGVSSLVVGALLLVACRLQAGRGAPARAGAAQVADASAPASQPAPGS